MPLIPFITIFLFRWRRLQMRFCVVEIVLLVILEALMVVQAFFMFNVVVIPLAGLLPLLGIIFSWLAYRAIRSDERLIRSIDRIR